MATVYVLVKNFDALYGEDVIHGSDFSLERFNQGTANGHRLRQRADDLFPTEDVQFSDWLYTRHYDAVPPSRAEQNTGCGDIPFQSEDLLLAFRLLKPGDISFAAQTIFDADGRKSLQHRYRYFSAINSIHPYYLEPAELAQIEARLESLATPSANTPWFRVARRFFLYGGAKEFNPQQSIEELDRIVDYAIALEAVLTYGDGQSGGILRRRACALLGLPPKHADEVNRLLSRFYGSRSAIAHGRSRTNRDVQEFHREMWCFEGVVRDILCAALVRIPPADDERERFLDDLAAVSDTERLLTVERQASKIQNPELRKRIMDALPVKETRSRL